MGEIIKDEKQITGIEKMNLYLTDEEIIKEDQELFYKKGIKEGIKQGIEQGIVKNKEEMIINMNRENISIEIIAKCTGLQVNEVKKIITEMDK